METSQVFPAYAVADDDLEEVSRGQPPFVSVYLRTERDVENAAQRLELRWRNLRNELADQGVAAGLLDAIDRVVADAHLAGPGVGVIADTTGVRLVDHGPLREIEERAVVAQVPSLLPIIRWRQEQPTVLVVLTDRRGADIFALRRSEPDVEQTVEGDDEPIRKVHPGGWSQRRYQERAENTWESNARNVADAVHRVADRVEPRVLAVAGDVRAVTLLREALRDDVDRLVHVIAGERPSDGGGDPLPDEVRDVVVTSVRQDGRALLERFREELGQRDLGVEGFGETLPALSRAQVGVLLVGDTSDARAWVGPDPTQIAASADDIRGLGVEDAHEVAGADAAVRAALGTGAAVRVYEVGDADSASAIDAREAPREGVGALLRWSNEARTET
jgi:hypothetical protein